MCACAIANPRATTTCCASAAGCAISLRAGSPSATPSSAPPAASCSPPRRRRSSLSTTGTPSPAFRSTSVISCSLRRTRCAASRAVKKGLPPPAAECASELATRHLPVNGHGCSASAEGAEPRLQPRITGTASTRLFQQPIRAALLLLLVGASLPPPGVAQQPAAAPPQQDEALVTELARLLAVSDARR